MSKKSNLEKFVCLNEIKNVSLPGDRLQKIGRSFVNRHATELHHMSKDAKLKKQSFDIKIDSVACLITELCLFY